MISISVLKTCFAFLFCYYLVNAFVDAVSTLQSAHKSAALQVRDNQASDVDVSIYELAFKFAFFDHDAGNQSRLFDLHSFDAYLDCFHETRLQRRSAR